MNGRSSISNPTARFKGITPVAVRVSVLWDLMPWCLVEAFIGGRFYCHSEWKMEAVPFPENRYSSNSLHSFVSAADNLHSHSEV